MGLQGIASQWQKRLTQMKRKFQIRGGKMRRKNQAAAAARGPKALFPVENASHTNIWQIAGERYEATLVDFFESTLA